MDQDLDTSLRTLLDKVRPTVESDGAALLSDYPEWTPELRTYIEKEYGHWRSTRDREGNFALGKAFHAFFSYWHYDHDDPPFHCYATRYGDVLFSKKAYRWIASEGRYEFEPKGTASDDPVTSCSPTIVIGFFVVFFAILILIRTCM